MAAGMISVDISQELYRRIERVAHYSGVTFQTAFEEGLPFFYLNVCPPTDDSKAEAGMETFSSVQLWAIIYRRFNPATERKYKRVLQKGKNGELSPKQEQQLNYLMKLNDYFVLTRSKALVFIKQRGYDIDTFLHSPDNLI